jgi:glycerophosphoryl diester phosphodiesterase
MSSWMVETRKFGSAWGRSWPPRIIAERGACWRAPENSLRAIRGAVDVGSDAIAIDVMRCGTGEVVCCYERTLAKFAGGRWDDVATTPLDTLRSIDLGGGEHMPLFAEALAEIPSDRLIDVRLRGVERTAGERRELAIVVMAIAARARAVERLLISSEDGAALAPFADAGAATSLIMPSMPSRPSRPAATRPRVVQLEIHSVGVHVMRHWHARNVAVHVWPANTRSQLALAWSLGVDGVLTNDPIGARDVLDQMHTRSFASSG